ncbi:hypothetical protein B0A49_06534 [Cryomyces minteri]|uniref:Sec1-like protein n=1 Tax=Cryomyces minteri TaxID=331657 RepID=A0A4U0WVU0_9PEZI|nr:hypothetical protein B0A49_06534 [Cryomyces minteri]
MAQKIVGVCVALGEYPTIRYYRPRNPNHEASVLCSHLARFVQDELDLYAKFHEDFPPASTRPRGALYIVDRSMDLYAPLVHEFTYQAMAHDLLPIKDSEKTTYRAKVNEGRPDEQEKDMEIGEKDKIWVQNRHQHMKDTIEKLMSDFQKFIDENPHFTNTDSGNASSLNAIKDMLAGLPQFQEMKEAYSLHLSMAQECMNIFQRQKLPDLASVEQSLATGLDEDYRKPKNMADQVVRTLDDESISHPDRLRLIAIYLLYQDGLIPADLQKLLAHAQLPPQDAEIIHNLELLGARTSRRLKDQTPIPPPLFARKPPPGPSAQEEYSLSRFEPALKLLLENHVTGTLDPTLFPYTKPPLDLADSASTNVPATSLRSAKPTWAKSRNTTAEPRQRIIAFLAGGATYSEARACYEVSRLYNRDAYLVTSHMLTPGLFMRQVGDLSVDKRHLNIPAEQPKPKAPAHIFEKDSEPSSKPPSAQPPSSISQLARKGPAPPTAAMANMTVSPAATPTKAPSANGSPAAQRKPGNKLTKEPEKEKKKKHHFFSSKKDKSRLLYMVSGSSSNQHSPSHALTPEEYSRERRYASPSHASRWGQPQETKGNDLPRRGGTRQLAARNGGGPHVLPACAGARRAARVRRAMGSTRLWGAFHRVACTFDHELWNGFAFLEADSWGQEEEEEEEEEEHRCLYTWFSGALDDRDTGAIYGVRFIVKENSSNE